MIFVTEIHTKICQDFFMISIVRQGKYHLIETKEQTKILILDNTDIFEWITREKGQMLERSHKKLGEENELAEGNYRLYHIHYEEKFTDEMHLELFVGEGKWQGYLLPNGFPSATKKTEKEYQIIPTKELITKVLVNEHQGAAWL